MNKTFTNIFCVATLFFLAACNNASKESKESTSFCTDTTCITTPMHFDAKVEGNPFVHITFKDCKIDSIHWEKGGMGVIKDMNFSEFIPNDIKPTQQAFACDIIGTAYAWLRFNDCVTGRGYIVRLPFDKTGTTSKYTSAINNFDPAYKVAEGLVAYYDNTFIYVQDINTGKTAKALITDTGVPNTDFSDVHSLIKSVDITKDHITAKITYEGKESEINKPLEFKDEAK